MSPHHVISAEIGSCLPPPSDPPPTNPLGVLKLLMYVRTVKGPSCRGWVGAGSCVATPPFTRYMMLLRHLAYWVLSISPLRPYTDKSSEGYASNTSLNGGGPFLLRLRWCSCRCCAVSAVPSFSHHPVLTPIR